MTHLNKDTLNLIFNFLWYDDLTKCEMVSKKWFNSINNNNFQYKRLLCEQLSIFYTDNSLIDNYKIILDSKLDYKEAFFYLALLPNNLYYDIIPDDDDNHILNKNNCIYFVGNELGGDRIIYMNNYLPKIKSYEPIPFIFPILDNGKYLLELSNIYYYEISVNEKSFRESWNDECIGIGFSKSNNVTIGYQIGWIPGSYGFHSDDGNIYKCSGHGIPYSESWGKGDTIGCGVIYKKRHVDIFYTKNGNFLGFAFQNIELTNNYLIPALSLDSSYGVYINFGQKEYKFKINNMIKDFTKYSNKIPINSFINTKIKNIDVNNLYQTENDILEVVTNELSNDLLYTITNSILNLLNDGN